MGVDFQINGANGKYDSKVSDPSVKYGRNAVENHISYMEAPLVNDKQTQTPILDFSPTSEASEKNIIPAAFEDQNTIGWVNSSATSTVRQAETATKNSPRPKYASSMATTKAIAAAMGDCVADSMAGKVMTASVTYGT